MWPNIKMHCVRSRIVNIIIGFGLCDVIFKNNNIKVTYLYSYHIPDKMQSKLKLQPDSVCT